jgi:hypothetical protein
VGAADRGLARRTALERALRVPWHTVTALLLFAVLLQQAVHAEIARGYPLAWLALAAIPAGLMLVRRPLILALVMVGAGTYLRALYLGYPETCDQLAVSRAALGVALDGGNPYGIGYPESVPPGSPFPYGPLAMVTSIGGVPAEILAATGIMLVLASSRALLTLAVMAAWFQPIEYGVCGINDQVPALLVLGGLLLIERRRHAPGALLVALSAGIKPYTFAWFPALVGGGGVVAVVLLAVAGAAWSPVLAWGLASYASSVEMARATHPEPANTLNLPGLRILALPVAIASLFVRSWTAAVLSGALIFLIVLFLDWWASVAYWFVVAPIVGIVAERALSRFGQDLRAAAARPRVGAARSLGGVAGATA